MDRKKTVVYRATAHNMPHVKGALSNLFIKETLTAVQEIAAIPLKLMTEMLIHK